MAISTRLSSPGERKDSGTVPRPGSTLPLMSKKLTQLTATQIEIWRVRGSIHGPDRRPLTLEKSCFPRPSSLFKRFFNHSFQALRQRLAKVRKGLGILFFRLLGLTTNPRKRFYAQRKLAAAGFRRPYRYPVRLMRARGPKAGLGTGPGRPWAA
jgi:hypothetical protein